VEVGKGCPENKMNARSIKKSRSVTAGLSKKQKSEQNYEESHTRPQKH